MEKLREHLGIDKWIVFGGSWGSTLSLAYSETHPDRCLGLILRGIFTLRREELLWFYQKGAHFMFADFFDDYEAVIPENERGDMMQAYYKRLTGDNEEERLRWCVNTPRDSQVHPTTWLTSIQCRRLESLGEFHKQVDGRPGLYRQVRRSEVVSIPLHQLAFRL